MAGLAVDSVLVEAAVRLGETHPPDERPEGSGSC